MKNRITLLCLCLLPGFHIELSGKLDWGIKCRVLSGADTISCQAFSSRVTSSLVCSLEWKLWRNGQCVQAYAEGDCEHGLLNCRWTTHYKCALFNSTNQIKRLPLEWNAPFIYEQKNKVGIRRWRDLEFCFLTDYLLLCDHDFRLSILDFGMMATPWIGWWHPHLHQNL